MPHSSLVIKSIEFYIHILTKDLKEKKYMGFAPHPFSLDPLP